MKTLFLLSAVMICAGFLSGCGPSPQRQREIKQAEIEAAVDKAFQKYTRVYLANLDRAKTKAPVLEPDVPPPLEFDDAEEVPPPIPGPETVDSPAPSRGTVKVRGNGKGSGDAPRAKDADDLDDYRLPGLRDLRATANAEGRVAIDCIESSSSIEGSIACTAGKLTKAELQKCVARPKECFGPSNTLRIHGEWVVAEAQRGNFRPAVAPLAVPSPAEVAQAEAALRQAQQSAEDAARRAQVQWARQAEELQRQLAELENRSREQAARVKSDFERSDVGKVLGQMGVRF